MSNPPFIYHKGLSSVTVPLHCKQLPLPLEICVLKIQTTCHRLSIPVMAASWCPSVWTPRPGVNWWQPLGVPADSGGLWACCSADGPVIRRRDRQAHSFYSLTAPLWDCWLTGLLFLLKAIAHRQLKRKHYEYTVSIEQRSSGLVLLVLPEWKSIKQVVQLVIRTGQYSELHTPSAPTVCWAAFQYQYHTDCGNGFYLQPQLEFQLLSIF